MLVAVGAVVALTSAAWAQDSTIFYDIRDHYNLAGDPVQDILSPTYPFTNGQVDGVGAFYAGGPGDGMILRLNPECANGWHDDEIALPDSGFVRYPNFDLDTDLNTGALFLYMDVNDVPGDGDCIASIGIDQNVTMFTPQWGDSGRNPIGSILYSWDPAYFNDVTNAGVEDGGSDGGDPPSWIGAKAVKVPVEDPGGGPVYACGDDGLPQDPDTSPYKLGRLDVTGGPRDTSANTAEHHLENSTYDLHLSVNNLLITRVFSSGGDAVEMVSFGYDPATGLPETAVSGSVEGNPGGEPDAVIQIHMKNDSNADGQITFSDIAVPPYGIVPVLNLGAVTTIAQRIAYTHDCSNDRKVDFSDIAGFVSALNNGGGC
jgi:hypothetical protein